jgi:hypothetical protein
VGSLCLVDDQPRTLDEEEIHDIAADTVEHEIAVTLTAARTMS